MKEALEHMNYQNETLSGELQQTKALLKFHRELLEQAMQSQTTVVD